MVAGGHHAAIGIGITTAVASFAVPDGIAPFAMKLLAALVTGLVSGIAVKAGGAIWSAVTRSRDGTRRRSG
jgi:hypothetical protein